jgi:hypothetical protein
MRRTDPRPPLEAPPEIQGKLNRLNEKRLKLLRLKWLQDRRRQGYLWKELSAALGVSISNLHRIHKAGVCGQGWGLPLRRKDFTPEQQKRILKAMAEGRFDSTAEYLRAIVLQALADRR